MLGKNDIFSKLDKFMTIDYKEKKSICTFGENNV